MFGWIGIGMGVGVVRTEVVSGGAVGVGPWGAT